MTPSKAAAKSPKLHVVREPLGEVDGAQVLVGLKTSLVWLQANQDQINDLNVFPVPDGDTGSNMYLTLRGAVEEAQHASNPASAAAVLAAAAHGSLMGARGNSGVILSQVLRGFSQGVHGASTLDAAAVAKALGEAAAVAYKAVIKPTEGTILTVVREAATAASDAADGSTDIRVVLDRAVREAHAAVERTTDQLAVLAEAGVVDAGGFGFAVILEGFSRAIEEANGEPALEEPRRRSGEPRVIVPGSSAPDISVASPVPRGAAAVAAKETGWGYCTEFLMHGPALDPDALRNELAEMGESALVVGDADLVRVHIHTENPAALIALATSRARLSKLKVEDMTAQHHDVVERAAAVPSAPAVPISVVAVAPGDGFREILSSLGCGAVVEGGQTMNPSIEDLVIGVAQANASAVIILPNNKNVFLTAEQVDALAQETSVRVVPSRNMPQGISALLAYNPEADQEENVTRMTEAMKHVRAIEITRAVRKSSAGGLAIRPGDVIAVVDDVVKKAGNDDADVASRALDGLGATPEIVTVYRGVGTSQEDAEAFVAKLQGSRQSTQFEIHDGGQEHYAYILSVE